MAIIVETCPQCGRDLMNETVCTYPPIPRRVCYKCGWVWEGAPEQVIRVPFSDDSVYCADLALRENTDYECVKQIDCCMVNNSHHNLFVVNQDFLDSVSKMNRYDIDKSIEIIKKYIKEE